MASEAVSVKFVADIGDLYKVLKTQSQLTDAEKELLKLLERENAERQKTVGILEQERKKLNQLYSERKKEQSIDEIQKYNKQIADSKNRLASLTGETAKLGKAQTESVSNSARDFNLLKQSISQIGPLMVAAFAINTLTNFATKVFEVTGQYEKLQISLKQILGTQAEASEKFAELNQLAAVTNFSVNEITDSFIKYANRGLEPSIEQLTAFGDIAASLGKPFNQLTEAILDVPLGQFKRLTEFGISAEKQGDKIVLSYNNVKKTVDATLASVAGAFTEFGKMTGVMGGMEAQSKGLVGKMSTLNDLFEQFVAGIGTKLSGVFHGFIDGAIGAIGWLSRFLGITKNVNEQIIEQKSIFTSQIVALGKYNEQIAKLAPQYDKLTQAEKENSLTGKLYNIALAERRVLINELNAAYGQYMPFLLVEASTQSDIAHFYELGNKVINERLRLKAAQQTSATEDQKLIELNKKLIESEGELKNVEEGRNLRLRFNVATQQDAIRLHKLRVRNIQEEITAQEALANQARDVVKLTTNQSQAEKTRAVNKANENNTMAKLRKEDYNNAKQIRERIAEIEAWLPVVVSPGVKAAYEQYLKDLRAKLNEQEDKDSEAAKKAAEARKKALDDLAEYEKKLRADFKKEQIQLDIAGLRDEFARREALVKGNRDGEIEMMKKEAAEKLKAAGVTGADRIRIEELVNGRIKQINTDAGNELLKIWAARDKAKIDLESGDKSHLLKSKLDDQLITQFEFDRLTLNLAEDTAKKKLAVDNKYAQDAVQAEQDLANKKQAIQDSDAKLVIERKQSHTELLLKIGAEAVHIDMVRARNAAAVREAIAKGDFERVKLLMIAQAEEIKGIRNGNLKTIPDAGLLSIPAVIKNFNKRIEIETNYWDVLIDAAEKGSATELSLIAKKNAAIAALEQERVEKVGAIIQAGFQSFANMYQSFHAFIDQGETEIYDRQIERANTSINANNERLDFLQGAESRASGRRKKELQAQIAQLQQNNKQEQAEIKKAEAEKERIRKEAGERKKLIDIASATIDFAKTVVGIWTAGAEIDAVTLGIGGTPYRILMTALATANFAAQVATIRSQKFAAGALDIQGPGTNTSDSIPARLSKGESVMTAQETNLYKPILQKMRDRSLRPDWLDSLTHQVELAGNSHNPQASSLRTDALEAKLDETNRTMQSIAETLKDLPVNEHIYDANGYARFTRQKNQRTLDIENAYT
jgi:hypothetical protein